MTLGLLTVSIWNGSLIGHHPHGRCSNLVRFLVSSITPPLPFLHKPLLHLLGLSLPKPLSSSGMENPPSPSTSLLVLSGKSPKDIEFAQSLKNNNSLKIPVDDTGVSVFLHSSKEVDKPYSLEKAFQMDSYMNALSTDRFGRFLIWSPRLSSTQDLISQNFCQLPIGAACVADVQFKGRGRSKNVWESPMGCLLFTFTVQMDDGRIVPLLQYVVSLAVAEAIKDVCNANGFPYLDIKIKWPNDLYLNGLKVGGILCTSTYSSKKFNVSAGIGLNVDNEKPTTSLNATLGEMTSDAYQLRREEILAAFFKRFEDFFDIFLSHGFQSLEESYYKAWLHSGQRVVIQEKKQGELVEDVAVTIQGLTSSGYLLATGDDNQFYELHPDGNSFDFFKGLIRRKIE